MACFRIVNDFYRQQNTVFLYYIGEQVLQTQLQDQSFFHIPHLHKRRIFLLLIHKDGFLFLIIYERLNFTIKSGKTIYSWNPIETR